MTGRYIKSGGVVVDLARVAAIASARLTNVFAVAGDGDALVYWDDTANPGVTATVTASTGQTASGASPVRVSGLTNGTPVTFTATRPFGAVSWSTDAVTPTAGDAGVIYYVDSVAGADTNDGLTSATPVKTTTKAATLPVGPGDAILYRRGSQWTQERFPVIGNSFSGAQNRPLTIGAYGRGAAPYLEGGQVLTGWQPYTTQSTNKQLIPNANIESFGTFGTSTVPTGWSVYYGSNGGSGSKETTIKDTGSTGSYSMNFGGGTNLLSVGTNLQLTAGYQYVWSTRVATDSNGAAAGVQVLIQVAQTDPDTGIEYTLQADNTWGAASVYWTITPTTSFTTTTTTFTAPYTNNVSVRYRNVASKFSGNRVLIDNNSFLASTPLPTSPNTYRAAYASTSGSYPGMLWVDENYRKVGSDPDRLADQTWYYDGSYFYYRQDTGNPANDGHKYEFPVQNAFTSIVAGHDIIVRDLFVRMYRSTAFAGSGSGSRLTFAENTIALVGSQSDLSGTSGYNGAINLSSVYGPSNIRGNILTKCNTDSLYFLASSNVNIVDNTVVLAMGNSADCCQLGDGGSIPMGPVYIARNNFDNRNSPSPKGALIISGSAMSGSVIEYNILRGGHFGLAFGTASGVEVRYNKISDIGLDPSNYVPWAAGLYSDTSGASASNQYVHHNLVHDCLNGINFTNGARENITVTKNTIVASTKTGFANAASFSTSSLTSNIFYNPTASAGEGVPATSSALTVANNTVGIDPQFTNATDYVPSNPAVAGRGWTVP